LAAKHRWRKSGRGFCGYVFAGIFFHIIRFGGKPNDVRAMAFSAATPATISGF
jgi:hypothetical protein